MVGIIFQSTARLPPSVRGWAKRAGGELTDSDQLSQLREAGESETQAAKAKSCHSRAAVLHPRSLSLLRTWHSLEWQATVVSFSSHNRHSIQRQLSTTIETTVNPVVFDICNDQSPFQETKKPSQQDVQGHKRSSVQLMIDWVSMRLQARSGGL